MLLYLLINDVAFFAILLKIRGLHAKCDYNGYLKKHGKCLFVALSFYNFAPRKMLLMVINIPQKAYNNQKQNNKV